jgi:hypothetical protein
MTQGAGATGLAQHDLSGVDHPVVEYVGGAQQDGPPHALGGPSPFLEGLLGSVDSADGVLGTSDRDDVQDVAGDRVDVAGRSSAERRDFLTADEKTPGSA